MEWKLFDIRCTKYKHFERGAYYFAHACILYFCSSLLPIGHFNCLKEADMPEGAFDYEVELHNITGAADFEEVLTVIHADGRREDMHLHEYGRVYDIPGLYELVVQEKLQCQSPCTVAQWLSDAAGSEELRVLDLGGGNGVVGDELRVRGIKVLVGSDCIEEARRATERDRPGLYADYVLDDGSDEGLARLGAVVSRYRLNAITCAGAIDEKHISLDRLRQIWSLFPSGSWISLTGSPIDVRNMQPEEVIKHLDASASLITTGWFQHRIMMDGRPIHYHIIVGHRP
jgi:hypothetical protein